MGRADGMCHPGDAQAVIAVASGVSPEAVNVLSVTAGSVLVPLPLAPSHRSFIHCEASAAIRLQQGNRSIRGRSTSPAVQLMVIFGGRGWCAQVDTLVEFPPYVSTLESSSQHFTTLLTEGVAEIFSESTYFSQYAGTITVENLTISAARLWLSPPPPSPSPPPPPTGGMDTIAFENIDGMEWSSALSDLWANVQRA